MNLESVITRLYRHIDKRLNDLTVSVTSGGVDSMEKYNYIIGQINALEATKQELSNLLEDKEQNEGTVIDINNKTT
tara:strand:- start:70 stop:297 length:228 start_codon:yes stop_codon:yes gene_type:complete